ncbi:histidine--tRNA ligase family protein [Candidatus Poribacteria bacterium]|nr:histidine--tRNA ligase family protein [Candidatus Poribacteria bacterium]
MDTFIKPTGTNDFLPEQMVQRNYVEKIIRETFESYGFSQIQTPLYESFSLLSAQAGEEIRHKMFTFVGPDRVDYALRPELTAPVCRIIANGDLQDYPFPYKLYYIGQCVRQEPKTNNEDIRREFRQAGIELIGSDSTLADTEVITIPVRILEKLNINNTQLAIGNTGILRHLLEKLNVDPKDQSEIILDIDHLSRIRLEKNNMDIENLRDELNTLRRSQGSNYQGDYKIDSEIVQGMSERNSGEWRSNLPLIAEETYSSRWNRYYDISLEMAQKCINISKINGDQNYILTEYGKELDDISSQSYKELNALCNYLEKNGITEFKINLGITRGFDFYTGTVFQIDDSTRNLPICGGGRYDRLIESFGGPSLPGAGFAFQFDLLVDSFLATDSNDSKSRKDYYIATTSNEGLDEAIEKAELLRNTGKTVEVDLMGRDFEEQQDYATKAQFDYILQINTDGSIKRTNLKTKSVETLTIEEL